MNAYNNVFDEDAQKNAAHLSTLRYTPQGGHMVPFRSLPKEDARVEKNDGSVVGPYKATFTGSTIFIWDAHADVKEGDIILRNLRNGKDERNVVAEAKFYQTNRTIPSHTR